MSNARFPLVTWVTTAVLLGAGPAAQAVTLEDPANFQVKNTFAGASLGIRRHSAA